MLSKVNEAGFFIVMQQEKYKIHELLKPSATTPPCVRIDVASRNKKRERRKGNRWGSTQKNTRQQ
ncbi:MAG TPA: hypothetical protein ENG83_08935 [Nitrospirae bacterium]|nr:hypothetical protein BMS3Abin06_01709 [bacterium BMS3Abin06]HDH12298.1 hypothetical protein [Nitrospirota bacterium]HDZ00805.1 hypothetical protein [Nitrospirota bacterium]